MLASRPRIAVGAFVVACAVGAFVVAFAVLSAGAADAVVRKVAYGKPGAVETPPVEGSSLSGAKPKITFPAHTLKRSPSARRDRQRICAQFQILSPAAPPATGWVVANSSRMSCAWIPAGGYASADPYTWDQAAIDTHYHARYVVTWSTKKKKKLAAATYDFNLPDDYKCVSTHCFHGQGTDNVPFIWFFGY